MERVIKFRVWDTVSKLWVAGWKLTQSGTSSEEKGYVWQQFTGLTDKNGKEIFEGDVIRFTETDEDSCFGREDTETVEVKWIEEIAQWRAIFKSGRRTELHLVVQLPTIVSCEVIGNIYENPDLLKDHQ